VSYFEQKILPSVKEEKESLFPSSYNLDEIDCMELEWGEFEEDLISNSPRQINPKNKTLRFYRQMQYHNKYYNSQEERKIYTKEEIEKFYNEHYMYNLRQLYMSKDPTFQFVWKTIDELNIRSEILSKSWLHYFDDNYLIESSRDKTQLAKDVLENGTYWPLVIGNIPESGDDKLYVFEGNHRVLSAKLLQLEGGWDNNRKFLCLQVGKDYYEKKQLNWVEAAQAYPMPKPVSVRVPCILRYDNRDIESDFVRYDKAAFDITDIDEDTIQFEIDHYNEYISAIQAYPHWLRDILYDYKQKTGSIIVPNEVINNEDKFNEWAAANE
jgi:hypothetical protein